MANISQEDRDRLSPVWDFSQERVFTMTLINQRFHFFLVFFSLVVGGALNARLQVHMSIILCVGAIIALLLAVPIFFTQIRIDKIMKVIVEDKTHPYTVIINMASGHVRISAIMSYIVTSFCSILLLIGAVLSLLGYLTVAPK